MECLSLWGNQWQWGKFPRLPGCPTRRRQPVGSLLEYLGQNCKTHYDAMSGNGHDHHQNSSTYLKDNLGVRHLWGNALGRRCSSHEKDNGMECNGAAAIS